MGFAVMVTSQQISDHPIPKESRPLPTSRFLAGSMVLIPSPGHRLLGEIPSFLGHTKGSLGIIQAELIITYETD